MVNYLCRHDIVSPSGNSDRGRGKMRKFTYVDVLLLRVIAKLLAQGISVLRLRKCLHSLKQHSDEINSLLSRKFLVTDGQTIYFSENNVLEALDSGQLSFGFFLELNSVRNEVDETIELLKRQA